MPIMTNYANPVFKSALKCTFSASDNGDALPHFSTIKAPQIYIVVSTQPILQ